MKKYKNIAFTLAELLIVIGIIGIVAEMTIPTLMKNFNRARYQTAVRAVYSTLSQATMQVLSANNGTLIGLYNNSDDVKNDFLPYLKTLKICAYGNSHGVGKCYPTSGTIRYLNGTVNSNNVSGRTSGLVLSNGMSIVFDSEPVNVKNCSFFGDTNTCAWIYVDVNGGDTGPNIIGEDIYDFQLSPTKILTDKTGSCIYQGESGWSGGGNDGWYCSTRVILGK